MKSTKSNTSRALTIIAGLVLSFLLFMPTPAHALTVNSTCQGGGGSTSSTGCSITPSSIGDIVFVVATLWMDASGACVTRTSNSTGGGETFHYIFNQACQNTGDGFGGQQIWASYFTAASTSSHALSVGLSGNANGVSLTAYDCTGCGTNFVTGSTSNVAVSATGTFQLASGITFAAGSLMIAGILPGVSVVSASAGTGFTGIFKSISVQNTVLGEYSTSVSSPSQFPWVVGSTGAPTGHNFDEIAFAAQPNTATINLTCILKESGATTETVTLTGGSPSPSTASCTTGAGTTTPITVTPSCTLTITVATDGANTRYRFNASATSSTTQTKTCPGAGASSSITIWNYFQLQNTYKMTPSSPATWDAGYTEPVIGTVTGVSSTTGCSVTLTNGGGAASCQTWFDYNLVVTEVASFASAVAGNWVSQAPNTFTQTTGGNTNNVNYILQFGSTFTIVCVNPTTCDNAMTLAITGTVGGSPATICTITTSSASSSASCTGNADTGTTATFAHFLTGPPAGTRYENQAGSSSTVLINNPFTFTVNYFKEDNQTVQYQIFCILGAVCGVPTIIYSVLGAQVGPTPMSMSDQAIWMDFGSSAVASASVTDNKGNTYTTSTTSWKITAPNVITHPIVYSTTSVATSTTTIVAWNAPDGKHYANGLGAMFFILLGVGVFACLPIIFRRRGDFVITMMLFGALAGLVVATLQNGQAANANSLIAPIGAIVMGGVLLVLWVAKGARGGPAQQ